MRSSLMMRAEMPSNLTVDLAISRITLAAMKAKARIPPNEEERSCAAVLRDVFLRDLGATAVAGEIPVEVVPQERMRHELEETLRTLAPVRSRFERADVTLMEKLVPILGEVADQGTLSQAAAEELLSGLRGISSMGQ